MADDNYKVGKGKPPLHTRFQPGQSGNPKGRPKGARNLRTEVLDELLSLVTIRENGKSITISKARAMIKAVMAKAAGGDVRATIFLLETGFKLEAPQEVETVEHGPDDAAILAAHRQRLFREDGHE